MESKDVATTLEALKGLQGTLTIRVSGSEQDVRSCDNRDLLVRLLATTELLKALLVAVGEPDRLGLEMNWLLEDCQDRIAQLDGTYAWPCEEEI